MPVCFSLRILVPFFFELFGQFRLHSPAVSLISPQILVKSGFVQRIKTIRSRGLDGAIFTCSFLIGVPLSIFHTISAK